VVAFLIGKSKKRRIPVSFGKYSIAKSEKVVLVFNNLFLLMDILAAVSWGHFWFIKATHSYSPVGPEIVSGAVGVYSLFGLVLLLPPWLIATIRAAIKARPESRKRVWILAIATLVALCLVPVAVWFFFVPSSEGYLVLVLSLIGAATVVSDILYSRTLKKSPKGIRENTQIF